MKGTAGKPGADGLPGEAGIGGSRVSLSHSGFIQSTNTLTYYSKCCHRNSLFIVSLAVVAI